MIGESPAGSNGKPEPTSWPDYWVRRRLVREAILPAHLKHFLHVLMDYAGDANEARASVDTLAADLSTSRSRVQMALKQLAAMKLVRTVDRPGRPSIRPIVWPAVEALSRDRHPPERAPTRPPRRAPVDPHNAPHGGHPVPPREGTYPPSTEGTGALRGGHKHSLNTQETPIERTEEARPLVATDSGTNGTANGKARPKPRTKLPGPETVPIPETLNEPAFLVAWSDWIADRHERRKTLTARGAALALRKLAAVGPEQAVAAIEQSIASGWTGVFPEREANGSARSGRRPSDPLSGVREWAARHADDESPVGLFAGGERR